MMKRKLLSARLIAATLILFSLWGCQKEISEPIVSNDATAFDEEGLILLKDRDPNIPLVLSMRMENDSRDESVYDSSFEELLGRSISPVDSPLESGRNLGSSVLDVRAMISSGEDFLMARETPAIDQESLRVVGCNSYESFLSEYIDTNRIWGGLNLKTGLFETLAKRSLEDVFHLYDMEEADRVFGLLKMTIRGKSYHLNIGGEATNRDIALKYMDGLFLLDLYDSPLGQFLEKYATGAILKSFSTGGCLTVLYTGKSKAGKSPEERISDIREDVNTSFEYSKIGEGISFTVGNIGGATNAKTYKTDDLVLVADAAGGEYGHASCGIVINPKEKGLSFSERLSSMRDPSSHIFAEMGDSGVYPLAEFIIENSLRERLEYEFSVTPPDPIRRPAPFHFYEPAIVVRTDVDKSSPDSPTIFEINLLTRRGEYIPLKGYDVSGGSATIDAVVEEMSKIFRVKVYELSKNQMPQGGVVRRSFLCSMTDLKKYVNPYTGVTYLLNMDDPYNKVGLSYHADFLLDTYGMREVVSKLPEVEMDPRSLFLYDITAL